MDIDEDDDFYAPEESAPVKAEEKPVETAPQTTAKPTDEDEDLEEGEEEDEGDSEGSSVRSHACYTRGITAENLLGHRYHHRTKRWKQSCIVNVRSSLSSQAHS